MSEWAWGGGAQGVVAKPRTGWQAGCDVQSKIVRFYLGATLFWCPVLSWLECSVCVDVMHGRILKVTCNKRMPL